MLHEGLQRPFASPVAVGFCAFCGLRDRPFLSLQTVAVEAATARLEHLLDQAGHLARVNDFPTCGRFIASSWP